MSRGTVKEPHGCQRSFTLIIVFLVVNCGSRQTFESSGTSATEFYRWWHQEQIW